MANRKTGSNTWLTQKGISDLRNFDCSRGHSSSKMLFQLVLKNNTPCSYLHLQWHLYKQLSEMHCNLIKTILHTHSMLLFTA